MVPRNLNYKMPAEWAAHACTFVSWPVREALCHPENYRQVCDGYGQIIKAIAEFEPVTVIANARDEIPPAFRQDKKIKWMIIEHSDAWIRDNGPTFLKNDRGERAGVNWRFNAWGGKYAPWEPDDRLTPQLLASMGIRCFDAPLIMEGGSFHVDGEGTLLTTEECLLNANRNPELMKQDIEDHLKDYLGIEKVIWLKRGLSGDETDGHVDNVASFAAPGVILLQVCADPDDDNFRVSRENLRILNETADAQGRKFSVIPVQQPFRRYEGGKRLTLSYLNFYYTNGGIILPVFGEENKENDARAVQTFAAVFPDRRIRTVDGMAIVREGGNVHCITQQMPEEIPEGISEEIKEGTR